MAAPPGLEGFAANEYGIPGLPPAAVPALAIEGQHSADVLSQRGDIAEGNMISRPPPPKRPRVNTDDAKAEHV